MIAALPLVTSTLSSLLGPSQAAAPKAAVGAGDSFDAGFLTAYLRGHDLSTCANAGNIAGALCTQGPGGTESFRDANLRDSFLKQHSFPRL